MSYHGRSSYSGGCGKGGKGGGYDNRQGYDSSRGGYDNSRQNYGESKAAYGDSRQGYDRQGYDSPRPGYGDSRQGYGDARQNYGDAKQGYNDGRQGYGDSRQGYGDAKQGYGDSRQGYGDARQGYDDYQSRQGYGEANARQGYGESRSQAYADPRSARAPVPPHPPTGRPGPSSSVHGQGSGPRAPGSQGTPVPPPPITRPSSTGPPGGAYGGGTGGGGGANGSLVLNVTGCRNETVSGIIKGEFEIKDNNHGKPVFAKKGGNVSVLIYYWDDRDGASFSGWWFGPKVGGDQVWAYNSVASAVPPSSGWRVPWDGNVDNQLQVTTLSGSGRRDDGRGRYDAEEDDRRRRDDRRREEDVRRREVEEARRREEDRRRREEEERRRREEEERHRREEEERRAVEEARRREEERRRREEERRRYEEAQQRKREEQARREAEEKKRREEEERRKKEREAANIVQKALHKLRSVTPETIDTLREELEETQSQQLQAMGSLANKIMQDVQKGIEIAQSRVETILREREEEKKRKEEEERKKREDEERVARLLKEINEEIVQAEEDSASADVEFKNVPRGTDVTPESTLEAAISAEAAVKDARDIVDAAWKGFSDKKQQMGDNQATRNAKANINEYQDRLSTLRRTLQKQEEELHTTRDKAARKSKALQRKAKREAEFEACNTSGAGEVTRDEVAAFSKSQYDFELASETLDAVLAALEPITIENFQRMRGMVAIAKSEAVARKLRAEEAERRRIAEERRKQVQAIVDEAEQTLGAAEKTVGKTEEESRAAEKVGDRSSNDMVKVAEGIEATVAKAKEEMDSAVEKLTKAEEECADFEECKGLKSKAIPWQRQRCSWIEEQIQKHTAAAKTVRDKAKQQAYTELKNKQADLVAAIRGRMDSETKTGEQLYEEEVGTDNGQVLKLERFGTFLEKLKEFIVPEEELETFYKHIIGEAEELTKDQFLELIKVHYKCIKGTVMSEDMTIKSKTVRKIDVNEVFEVLEGPVKDSAGILRVRCKATTDEATGWVTVAGNAGTKFLEPGGKIYSCLKETVMTDALSVQESKTVRKIAQGEAIDVLEFPKKDETAGLRRIKGKAQQDGAVGWISVSSSSGTVFLEPR